jgi:hypothetical protein
VQLGVTISQGAQLIEHAGDILRHADLIGLGMGRLQPAPEVPSGPLQRAAQRVSPTAPIMTESAPLVIRSRACPAEFTHLGSIRFTVPILHRA